MSAVVHWWRRVSWWDWAALAAAPFAAAWLAWTAVIGWHGWQTVAAIVLWTFLVARIGGAARDADRRRTEALLQRSEGDAE